MRRRAEPYVPLMHRRIECADCGMDLPTWQDQVQHACARGEDGRPDEREHLDPIADELQKAPWPPR